MGSILSDDGPDQKCHQSQVEHGRHDLKVLVVDDFREQRNADDDLFGHQDREGCRHEAEAAAFGALGGTPRQGGEDGGHDGDQEDDASRRELTGVGHAPAEARPLKAALLDFDATTGTVR